MRIDETHHNDVAQPQGGAAGQSGLPTPTAADEAPLAPDAAPFGDDNAPPTNRRLAPGASNAPAPAEPDHPTPDERAERTAFHWSRGTEAIIACGVEVSAAWRALRNDPAGMRTYVAGLEQRGMLTKREAEDPQGSAKLSRLKKIGDHEAMLRHPDICRLVGAGYTKLERCCDDEAKGTDEQKQQKLLEILEQCGNEEVDRAYLHDEYKKLTRERNAPANGDEEPPDETGDDETQEPAEADGTTTWSELRQKKRRFDRVLITPRAEDKRLLAKKLADPDKLSKELPLREILARNAVIVIAMEGRDLLHADFLGQLFREWGVKRTSDLLLARRPTGPRMGTEMVLVTVECGDLKHQAAVDELWAKGTETLDVPALVERVFSGESRLHVFAEQARDGWTVLRGDDGWVDAPGDAT